MDDQWDVVDPGELPPPYFSFANIGDKIVGYLTRTMEVVNNFDASKKDLLYIITTKNVATGQLEERSLNPNADLRRRLAMVALGKFIKVEFTDTLNTGKASPMKVFSVAVSKTAAAAPAVAAKPTVKPAADEVPF